MRCTAALLMCAAFALAERGERLSEAQRQELVRVVGAERWGALPAWRQHMVAKQYHKFLQASERQQTSIRAAGLREFLMTPRQRDEMGQLPQPLKEEIGKLAPEMRGLAARLAYTRLRQLRLDRSLRRVPAAQRWPLFRRLFPEPFDQAVAKKAHKKLRRFVVNAIAKDVRARLAAEGLDPKKNNTSQ